MQTGTSGPRVKDVKWSTLGVRRSQGVKRSQEAEIGQTCEHDISKMAELP